ncbi:MAG: class I SAM-dependent methyltransferase [Clostridia bacterium]|nr:class I SAM-dependent methyltransferase [Clostridia bacterium]
MNDHYYTVNPNSAHDVRRVKFSVLGNELMFDTDAGVFSRDGLDVGSKVLMEALPDLHGRVLDLGCGWGAVGVSIKKKWPEIELVMTDVNQRAADLSKSNLALNRVSAQVLQGDGFENVEGKFDFVITNPPIRAGKQAIYGMFADAREHLNDGGELYIVIRKQQGAPSALKYLSEIYSESEVVEKEAGFWVIRSVK